MNNITSLLPSSIIPLGIFIENIVNTIQLLVGGIFGIYLIMAFLKWKESRQLLKEMKMLRLEVQSIKNIIEKKKK